MNEENKACCLCAKRFECREENLYDGRAMVDKRTFKIFYCGWDCFVKDGEDE